MEQAKQWVSIRDDEVTGSPDKLCFLMKARAKVFSRTDKFVGCFCITGPPGGGKGTVLFEFIKFGGEGRSRLCCNMGPDYFFDTKVRGAEDCKPVLAASAGAAVAYSDEYPNKELNPETLKPLICMRGGQASARFGGARETQDTSFDITATPFGAGNYPLRTPYSTIGLDEKIYNLSPDFIFRAGDECTAANHVPTNEAHIDAITDGTFAAEYVWWLQQWFVFVDDARFVKGRLMRPLPAGIQSTVADDDTEGAERKLGMIATLVQSPLQGDCKQLVNEALKEHFGDAAPHMVSQLGLGEQAAQTGGRTNRKTLYRVYWFRKTTGKVFVRLLDDVRTSARQKYRGACVLPSPYSDI